MSRRVLALACLAIIGFGGWKVAERWPVDHRSYSVCYVDKVSDGPMSVEMVIVGNDHLATISICAYDSDDRAFISCSTSRAWLEYGKIITIWGFADGQWRMTGQVYGNSLRWRTP